MPPLAKIRPGSPAPAMGPGTPTTSNGSFTIPSLNTNVYSLAKGGQADQDRREGREPRPLCRLPDGRGRHRTANVPRDFAAHRGATAAATTSASVRRSMSCIQEQPTEGVRPNARENAQ